MKKTVLPLMLAFLLIALTTAPSIEAGQIVSKELKSWAQAVITGKPSARIATVPGSIAVLYFSNQTGRSDIAPLRKGLSVMLSADLSAVKGIRIVERARVQALYDALGLNPSKPISADTALRLGKMLGAFYVISGNIVRGRITDLKITANLVEVPNEMLLDQPVSAGDLADLVSMEKEILFDLINAMQLALKPAQLKALEQPVSADIDALYLLFRGIDTSDRGKYETAADLYKKALRQDPQLAVASSALKELQVEVFRAQAPQPVKPAPAAAPRVQPSAPATTPPATAAAQATTPSKVQPPATKPQPTAPAAGQPPAIVTAPEAKTAQPDTKAAATPPQPAAGTPASPADDHKMSTGTIVAIGLGAAAVIGGIAVAAGGGGGGGDDAPPGGTTPPPEPGPQPPRIAGVDPPTGSEVPCNAGTVTFTFDTDMDTSAGQVGVSVSDWQFSGSFADARTYVITWDDNCPEPGSSEELPATITFVFANFQDTSQTPLEGDVEFTFDLAM